jgi:hypothetical protein
LGGISEDSNTNMSLPSSPKEDNEECLNVQSNELDKQTIEDSSNEKEKINDEPEESHTPPLLPNMKVKPFMNEKEKDNKIKKANWDMFADQDIFKADTNVNKKF